MSRVPFLRIRKRSIISESESMGLTHVTVKIRNPADASRAWEGLFLVDTGSIDSMVPEEALRSIGMNSVGTREYELANATVLKFDICVAQLEYSGDVIGGTVIFGPDDCEPILGVTALESLGLVVDPQTQQLKRLPAISLKGARPGN